MIEPNFIDLTLDVRDSRGVLFAARYLCLSILGCFCNEAPMCVSNWWVCGACRALAGVPAAAKPHQPHQCGGANTFAPFTRLAIEFNKQLEYVVVNREAGKEVADIRAKDPKKQYLPGQPRIRLGQDSTKPHVDSEEGYLPGYLSRYHLTKDLDELLPWMRYVFVQTPTYDHITPIHHQKARSRKILVDEEPGLHLVWYYDSIFIKPIPAYFYSQAFWEYLKNHLAPVYKASLGFMRSYYYLIRFELDFDEAIALKLIPKKDDGSHPTYEEWCEFIMPFSLVGDNYVNRRYHYGELRMTRVNRLAFTKGQLAYFHILPQWGSFLSHILAPLITAFAVCSVILNSMQVTLAAIEVAHETNYDIPAGGWHNFIDVSLYFPVVVNLLIAFVLGASMLGLTWMGCKDLLRGNTLRERKRKGEQNIGRRTHGIIW
ncbi:hypothetical protein QBC35DRAFT_514361 [Podospora australis]|uniref:Uncharacterized protein n=1 Tax=Podospora australis TaxID=1536484 RepID=A0AAN7AJ39_9PEZI|nr:hypothetical protein QBC35DRAFT_514361 [Podospora australis]